MVLQAVEHHDTEGGGLETVCNFNFNWYKASALPLPTSFGKKFESLMGRFLWAGKLERLQIDEVKNPRSSGGLGLPCVWSKSNALFLRQTCRLISDPDSKQYCHV